MKQLLTIAILLMTLTVNSQESLLLGEIKLDEIQPQKGDENLEIVMIYGKKYKKNGYYKDSINKGSIYYNSRGDLLENTTFSGKKNRNKYVKKYLYDLFGNVTSFDYQISTDGVVIGKTVDFFYNDRGKLTRQVISLANITYNYNTSGKLSSKKYYYNNGNDTFGAPWSIYFKYDENGNLIHADHDTSGNVQTSFYNDKNQLIRHDYYPGVAYSTYFYDEQSNCVKQIDYEIGKKGWDSTAFVFAYDKADRLIMSSSSNKKGKISIDQEWIYFEDGRLKAEIFYRKNKKKWVNRYYYEYYPFK
jgi:hypothetical protein